MTRRKAQARNRSSGRGPTAKANEVWLYGLHTVRAALANPKRHCRRLFATREALRDAGSKLSEFVGETGVAHGQTPHEIVPRAHIDDLLPRGAVHQGLALAATPLAGVAVEDLIAAAEGRTRAAIVVLDRVSDPQNMGAVLRVTAGFGAQGMIVPDRHTPRESGAMAKAASGALETVPLARAANLARALEQLKEAGFWCVGLDGGAADSLAGADLPERLALVLGAEGAGLRRLTRERCDLLLRIPLSGTVESLNLSTACAVALWEVARRKPADPAPD